MDVFGDGSLIARAAQNRLQAVPNGLTNRQAEHIAAARDRFIDISGTPWLHPPWRHYAARLVEGN